MQPDLIYTNEWQRRSDNVTIREEKHRIKGGILYEMYIKGERAQFLFSKRPYVLGQSCDGTIDTCVAALFLDFCEKNKLDAKNLYSEAYPENTPSYQAHQTAVIKKNAKLEGVIIPKKWDQSAFDGLIDSLVEINNHSLVNVLLEKNILFA